MTKTFQFGHQMPAQDRALETIWLMAQLLPVSTDN